MIHLNDSHKFQYFRLFFISWSLFIIISSSIPHLPDPKIKVPVPGAEMKIRIDYLIHFLEFFILSILFIFMKVNNSAKLKFKHISCYVILGMGAAFLIELYQEFIPWRTFNIIDFIYKSLGLITGVLSVYLLRLKKNEAGILK
jgi:VanZ family protein